MTPEEKRKLKDSFNHWAEKHPEPNTPCFGFRDTGLFSPRQLACELENETPTGKNLMSMLEYGVAVEGIDRVIARMTNKS